MSVTATRSVSDPMYYKHYKIDHARGLRRMEPVDRVRAHVEGLLESGMSKAAIADAAGVARITVRRVADGQPTIRTTSAEALLRVNVGDLYRRAGNTLVPAVGARRRVQALMVMGWRLKDIIGWTGIRSAGQILYTGPTIELRIHEAICRAYDRFWFERGPSELTRARALKAGYQSPLAWDDGAIDDPDSTPEGASDVFRAGSRVEDVEFLMETGCGQAEVMSRAGFRSHEALVVYCERNGREDLSLRFRDMGRLAPKKFEDSLF